MSPPVIEEHMEPQTAYFGALSFTKPVERLVLQTVPLPSILCWLTKPKGPNLVEASDPANGAESVLCYRALTIAATGEMLYREGGPLVGVGLVYRPTYIPTMPFSATYMCLNEWHATSDEASEGHL